jgi:hypothetical protein
MQREQMRHHGTKTNPLVSIFQVTDIFSSKHSYSVNVPMVVYGFSLWNTFIIHNSVHVTFQQCHMAFELWKPSQTCVLPTVCPPKATWNILKISLPFFLNLKPLKNLCASHCLPSKGHLKHTENYHFLGMHKSHVDYACTWQDTAQQTHKLQSYCMQEMNQQTQLNSTPYGGHLWYQQCVFQGLETIRLH